MFRAKTSFLGVGTSHVSGPSTCVLGFKILRTISLESCDSEHLVPISLRNFSSKLCLKTNRYYKLIIFLSGQVMRLSSLFMNVSFSNGGSFFFCIKGFT